MHYVVYLDEFGHIGPFVSKDHEKYNDSPVFGFAGVVLPAQEVREFAIYFYKLKCRLLAWDLENKNPEKRPPYQWEKKGSAVYTVTNVDKYQELRKATFRLLNYIEKIGGHVFYTGAHKTVAPTEHDSAEIFKRQLVQTIRKLDRFCSEKDHSFLVLLDEQDAGDRWRESNVEACTLAMFEDQSEKCRTLIEPPLQGESHLFQTLQCADWICGLVGRLAAFSVAPAEYAEWEIFHKYFHDRLQKVMLPCSGLEQQNTQPVAPDVFEEPLPNVLAALSGQ
ncbi:DUF3800 domain-containing protein [Burkholderia cepacia]|uniref:DUF3800 domain-containing protein n=1 Tax=Burkholderia cepacia TaxID=292 RepID=UPI0019071F3D|nr:DUF3800 domain-containing protein [Burkholderia cepacia]MBJ9756643.1 DUF3800 domain-containing protein [Burkholderia cepacia]